MTMKYTINEWCAACGKTKQYSGVYSGNESDNTITPPEMCTCNNTVSIHPMNSVPLTSSTYYFPTYHDARLIPENMQELEAMVRRVVSEELAKMFIVPNERTKMDPPR